MTAALLAVLAGLGFAGGVVAGLVGVGGAIVMVPLLYYVLPALGLGVIELVQVTGITMAQVLATALVATIVHSGVAQVHWRLVGVGGASMATGSLAGALMARHVGGRVLLTVFGTMGTLALLLLLVSPRPVPPELAGAEVPFRRAVALVLPAGIGVLSGLVGAGGAFLLLPALTALMRIPLRLAIGTSLAITVVSATAGLVGKVATAQVPLWPAAAVVSGSVAGAVIGARLSRRAPVGLLRGVLGGLITLAMLRVWLDVFSP